MYIQKTPLFYGVFPAAVKPEFVFMHEGTSCPARWLTGHGKHIASTDVSVSCRGGVRRCSGVSFASRDSCHVDCSIRVMLRFPLMDRHLRRAIGPHPCVKTCCRLPDASKLVLAESMSALLIKQASAVSEQRSYNNKESFTENQQTEIRHAALIYSFCDTNALFAIYSSSLECFQIFHLGLLEAHRGIKKDTDIESSGGPALDQGTWNLGRGFPRWPVVILGAPL